MLSQWPENLSGWILIFFWVICMDVIPLYGYATTGRLKPSFLYAQLLCNDVKVSLTGEAKDYVPMGFNGFEGVEGFFIRAQFYISVMENCGILKTKFVQLVYGNLVFEVIWVQFEAEGG